MFDFIKKRIKSVGYAFRGMVLLIVTEPSIQVQLFIAICMTVAGVYFHISPTEWILQLLAIAIVMAMEGANTAVEEIADFIHPDYHEKIGRIKDFGAGAVFIAAIIAVIIGLIIYLPKIENLF